MFVSLFDAVCGGDDVALVDDAAAAVGAPADQAGNAYLKSDQTEDLQPILSGHSCTELHSTLISWNSRQCFRIEGITTLQ